MDSFLLYPILLHGPLIHYFPFIIIAISIFDIFDIIAIVIYIY
jgi:hypothetical protein